MKQPGSARSMWHAHLDHSGIVNLGRRVSTRVWGRRTYWPWMLRWPCRVPCDRCDDLRRGSLGSGHPKHSPLPPGSDWAPPSPRLKPIQQAVTCPMCSSGGAWVGRCAGQGGEDDEGSTGQKDDLKLEEREVPFLGPLHPASPLLPLLVLALISLLLSHHLYLSLTHLFVFL